MKTAFRYAHRRSIPLLTAAGLALALTAAVAAETWDDRFGVPNLNSSIQSIDRSPDGQIAIGGYFSGNGFDAGHFLNANKVAIWNGRAWSRTGSGPNHGPGDVVRAVQWIGNELYVGGEFVAINGTPINRIARWTGNEWSPLVEAIGEGVNDYVYALAEREGELVAGGRFTAAGEKAASRIASWDGVSWSALGAGVSGGVNPFVHALAVAPDGTIYAGGRFSFAGGLPASGIARWNGTTWSALGGGIGGPDPIVYAVALAPNGDVVVGGSFTSAGETPVHSLARWDGSAWSDIGGGVAEGQVRALAFEGSKLWVGGTFQSAGGYQLRGLGLWSDGAWSSPAGSGIVDITALKMSADGLYLVGSFSKAGDKDGLLGMAHWDGTEFHALHHGFSPSGPAPAEISVAGENVMVSGEFTAVGGRIAHQIARWDGSGWQAYGDQYANGVPPGFSAGVFALAAAEDGTGYAGGFFGQIAGINAANIAHWNGQSWEALGSGIQAAGNPSVRALSRAPEGTLFVGGRIDSAGGAPAKNIAMWNGTNWLPLADGLASTTSPNGGVVLALAWAGDRLYAGGTFDRSGALAVNGIAWWDGANWHAIDGGVAFPGFGPSVQALATRGFELFIGGNFSEAGGVPASRVARWQPATGWSAMHEGFNSSIYEIVVHGPRLFAGGNFTHTGSTELQGLAEWNGTTWQEVGGGLFGGNAYVFGLAAAGTNLYVGGYFETAGPHVSSRFGIYNMNNAPPSVAWQSPAAGAYIPAGGEIILEVNPTDEDGSIASVEFFAESSATPLATVNAAPWKFTWDGAATGSHRLAARVTDNSGATTWTPVRRVEVLPPGGNAPPQVAITSPENGSTFKATPDRLLIADATDADGAVVQVDFYSSNVPLGTATTAPWQIIWPDLQAGVYPLRAVAWDNSGAKATSVVVNVTVLPPNDAPYLEINDIYEGTVMEDPGTLTLRANSSDGDGGLTSVVFQLNDVTVASFTNDLERWHFTHLWEPVLPGGYAFRVVATDTDGATTERLVNFTVTPFNQPPQVTLHGPADGSSLGMPNSIPLLVEASDPDGEVVEVRWLSGEAVLGSKTNTPWVFNLRNLAAADYYLRAQAIDNLGKIASTPPVTITVTNDPAAQPRYRLVELTPPGGDEGDAYDINQLGQVSATLRNGDSNTRGYRYFDGTYLDIGDTVTPRQPASLYCTGINDSGAIAGFGHINSLGMAFLWQNNTLTELGVLGERYVSGMFSHARAINNLGHVVGGSRNSNGVDRAFLYRDGQLTDLGGLGPTLDQSEAFDLNDQDEVVGWVMGSAGRRAFIYDPVNGMRELGAFGGSQASTATGINAHGQVVGSYQDQNNRTRAFLWSGGIEVQLGTFGGESEALALNDRGQIVGTANIEGYGPSAFLWQGCALFNLNRSITNANWHLVAANAINNAGWIVGWGRKDFQLQRRAFLLIPDDSAGPVQPYSPITFYNGRFQMCVPVPPGTTYRLDASADLKNWTAISTNYVPEGVLDFRDPEAEEHPTRFYRAVLLP